MAFFIFLILNIMEQPVEVLFYFILCYFLGLDIMKSVILPLVIIATSRTRLPQLFSSDSSSESGGRQFYVRRPIISPRHQVQMAALASQPDQLITCITVTECSDRK